MYSPVLVTPAEPILDLDEVKEHLYVDHTDDDDMIEAFIDAATTHVERKCGIVLGAQTWRLDFDNFTGCMRLPVGPALAITAITYKDGPGTVETVSESNYDLLTDYLGPYVRLKNGFSSPSNLYEAAAVRITWTAGSEVVPPPLVSAAKLIVGDLYANREAQSDVQLVENPTANALMSTYRVY